MESAPTAARAAPPSAVAGEQQTAISQTALAPADSRPSAPPSSQQRKEVDHTPHQGGNAHPALTALAQGSVHGRQAAF